MTWCLHDTRVECLCKHFKDGWNSILNSQSTQTHVQTFMMNFCDFWWRLKLQKWIENLFNIYNINILLSWHQWKIHFVWTSNFIACWKQTFLRIKVLFKILKKRRWMDSIVIIVVILLGDLLHFFVIVVPVVICATTWALVIHMNKLIFLSSINSNMLEWQQRSKRESFTTLSMHKLYIIWIIHIWDEETFFPFFIFFSCCCWCL